MVPWPTNGTTFIPKAVFSNIIRNSSKEDSFQKSSGRLLPPIIAEALRKSSRCASVKRGQRITAISDDIRGHSLAHFFIALGIDQEIGIIVAVRVDKAGANRQATGIYGPPGIRCVKTVLQACNFPVNYSNVGIIIWVAGPVDYAAVFDNQVQVIRHRFLLKTFSGL
jgi:hypothetical protein